MAGVQVVQRQGDRGALSIIALGDQPSAGRSATPRDDLLGDSLPEACPVNRLVCPHLGDVSTILRRFRTRLATAREEDRPPSGVATAGAGRITVEHSPCPSTRESQGDRWRARSPPAILWFMMVLLAVAAVLSGSGNPWRVRCPSMPLEAPVPQRVQQEVRGFFPWVPIKDAGAIRSGPVWLFALSNRTTIARDGDSTDPGGRYLHRALVAASPAYPRQITIRGRRLGAAGPRTRLAFTTGASTCGVSTSDVSCRSTLLPETPTLTIPAGHRWRIVRTEIAIGRTGCFTLTATGAGLHTALPLAVPGPDWGTAGW